ncbi:flavodoxin domain-containing protein [Methanoplanus endosymbiosus]|uniref:Flavodoxin domain-containing protein n=1 Tax=Methanoplanus endosymbiosus TaxID=33865 RepID=A0A9E7PS81_9EURY|nr:flavodoxin domain-containing protein [Methanoplanus endosymbiosus]UUX92707.1 flavodoxin domain-containing protein [Methanoplanus endosymbiosus]
MTAGKVLVAYATRYGSTKDIAEVIADTIRKRGIETDCMDINTINPENMSVYDAFFVGSPLHLGKWLPEAKEFMQFRRDVLNKKPVFVFTCGITLKDKTEHILKKAEFALYEFSQYVKMDEKEFFAGKLTIADLNETDSQIVRIAGVGEGDYTDINTVNKWADGIADKYLKAQ